MTLSLFTTTRFVVYVRLCVFSLAIVEIYFSDFKFSPLVEQRIGRTWCQTIAINSVSILDPMTLDYGTIVFDYQQNDRQPMHLIGAAFFGRATDATREVD